MNLGERVYRTLRVSQWPDCKRSIKSTGQDKIRGGKCEEDSLGFGFLETSKTLFRGSAIKALAM